jgi:hypothetical protein
MVREYVMGGRHSNRVYVRCVSERVCHAPARRDRATAVLLACDVYGRRGRESPEVEVSTSWTMMPRSRTMEYGVQPGGSRILNVSYLAKALLLEIGIRLFYGIYGITCNRPAGSPAGPGTRPGNWTARTGRWNSEVMEEGGGHAHGTNVKTQVTAGSRESSISSASSC